MGLARGEGEAAERAAWLHPETSGQRRPAAGLRPRGALVQGAGFGVPAGLLSASGRRCTEWTGRSAQTTFFHLYFLLPGCQAPREGPRSLLQEQGCLLR